MSSERTTRRWDVDFHLAEGELSLGIRSALRAAVSSGTLAPGTRLPSSRTLAEDLGVARNTVTDAYAQLVAEGWLDARQGSGTWVADRATDRLAVKPPDIESRMATVSRFRYNLEPGSPNLSAFPRSDWLKATRRALAAAPNSAFGYGDARGRIELRSTLAEYLGRVRGVRCHPDQIMICSGFAQVLALISSVLHDRGGRLAMESLTHWGHTDIVQRAGVPVAPIPLDGQGARIDQLDSTTATAVMLTPAHQYPTGVPLSPLRRQAAVEWARRTDGLVIEDDYDGEFQYDRRPLTAIQALDPDHVAYCGTASKSLAPGLRLAWVVLPEPWIALMVHAKQAADHATDAIGQLTLADFIRSGSYDRHIRRSRISYRRRRNELVDRLARDVGWVEVRGTATGLHAVLEYANRPDLPTERELLAAAEQHDLILPGMSAYGPVDHDRTAVLIGYATPPDHAYSSTLDTLCQVLQSAAAQARSRR